MGGGTSKQIKFVPGTNATDKKQEQNKELLEDTTKMDFPDFLEMDATFINNDGGQTLKEPTTLFAAKTKIKEWLKNYYHNVDEFFRDAKTEEEFHEKMNRLWSNLE